MNLQAINAVYCIPQLPGAFVVYDTAGLGWIVDARPNGWADRRPYRGYSRKRLERLGYRVSGASIDLAMATV